MTSFNLTSIILCLFVISCCHGFEFNMERKNFSLKGKPYCGLLRCHVDNVTEDNVSALIKMDIYYLNNRTLLSTMLPKDSDIQSHTGNTVTITGSMSEHHGELRLYFTERVDCLEANYICRINFLNANGLSEFSEKTTVSTSREKDGKDLYMKSQISFEQTISDQSGQFLKNLISPNDLLRDRMAFSFQTVNSDPVTLERTAGLPLYSLTDQKTKQEPNINLRLSGLESRLVSMFNKSMTDMFMNIKNMMESEKNVHRTTIENQYIETNVQGSDDAKFLKLDAKLNEMMTKAEVCVSRQALTQDNDGHVNMSQIERSLDSISQKLDDLWTSQKMPGESLANLSSTPAHLKQPEKQLKCERGMNSSLIPRVVTSINNNKKVLCDTKTDGGGWIIIQRRVKGDTSFNVSWDSYKQGFGSLHGDFWLGNDVISNLTRTDDYMLRMDMTCVNVDLHAIYSYFKVEDEAQLYTLRLGAYSGNATDRLSYNKDQTFTTLDRDNDKHADINCANNRYHNSGWWHKDCSLSNLNGVWGSQTNNLIYWDQQKQNRECSFVEMKIRKK